MRLDGEKLAKTTPAHQDGADVGPSEGKLPDPPVEAIGIISDREEDVYPGAQPADDPGRFAEAEDVAADDRIDDVSDDRRSSKPEATEVLYDEGRPENSTGFDCSTEQHPDDEITEDPRPSRLEVTGVLYDEDPVHGEHSAGAESAPEEDPDDDVSVERRSTGLEVTGVLYDDDRPETESGDSVERRSREDIADGQRSSGSEDEADPVPVGIISEECTNKKIGDQASAENWEPADCEQPTTSTADDSRNAIRMEEITGFNHDSEPAAGYDHRHQLQSMSDDYDQIQNPPPASKPALIDSNANRANYDPEDPDAWLKDTSPIPMDRFGGFACISCLINLIFGSVAMYLVQKGRESTSAARAKTFGWCSVAVGAFGILVTIAVIVLIVVFV